jgi:hypothetical protein
MRKRAKEQAIYGNCQGSAFNVVSNAAWPKVTYKSVHPARLSAANEVLKALSGPALLKVYSKERPTINRALESYLGDACAPVKDGQEHTVKGQ